MKVDLEVDSFDLGEIPCQAVLEEDGTLIHDDDLFQRCLTKTFILLEENNKWLSAELPITIQESSPFDITMEVDM